MSALGVRKLIHITSITSRIPRVRLEKVKSSLAQDEASMRALDSFLSTEDSHALFATAGPSDSIIFTLSVCYYTLVQARVDPGT